MGGIRRHKSAAAPPGEALGARTDLTLYSFGRVFEDRVFRPATSIYIPSITGP